METSTNTPASTSAPQAPQQQTKAASLLEILGAPRKRRPVVFANDPELDEASTIALLTIDKNELAPEDLGLRERLVREMSVIELNKISRDLLQERQALLQDRESSIRRDRLLSREERWVHS